MTRLWGQKKKEFIFWATVCSANEFHCLFIWLTTGDKCLALDDNEKNVQIDVISEKQLLLSDLLMAYVQMDDFSMRALVCIHFPRTDLAYGHNAFIIG